MLKWKIDKDGILLEISEVARVEDIIALHFSCTYKDINGAEKKINRDLNFQIEDENIIVDEDEKIKLFENDKILCKKEKLFSYIGI